jgi:hypothetical protein
MFRRPDHRSFTRIVLFLVVSVSCLLATSHAGAWTFERGTLWSKVTFLTQSTNEEYKSIPESEFDRGDRGPYRLDGEYSSRAVFFDLFYGVTDRFNIGLQIPFFRQSFEDAELRAGFGGARRSTGFSDIRVFLKHRLIIGPIISSFKFGFKAPTGDFRNEQGLIPTGEGQWDFDFILQLGRSFWPFRAYANADLGYRARLKNDTIDRDPGDEFFWIGEFGYQPLEKVLATLKCEGIRGKQSVSLGIQNASDVKRITYISQSVSFGPFNGTQIETSLRISINGQNFPAGPVLTVGLTYQGNPFGI